MGNTGVVRYNFAAQHMAAAARYARQCHRVELENEGEQFGAFYEVIRNHATASVLFAVAALEANINETFADANDGQISFEAADSQVLKEVWSLIEKKPVLEKYQYALVLRGKKRMSRGMKEYQFADTLIDVRNELVHYKPEWSNELDEHKKIGKRLRGKFTLSPFVDANAPIFPKRCMCHSFARWAVESALEFADHFSERADISNRFTPFEDRFGTVDE